MEDPRIFTITPRTTRLTFGEPFLRALADLRVLLQHVRHDAVVLREVRHRVRALRPREARVPATRATGSTLKYTAVYGKHDVKHQLYLNHYQNIP